MWRAPAWTDELLLGFEDYASWLEHRDPAGVANTVLRLIHQANYLLDQQIAALEHQFFVDGGCT